MQPTWCNNQSGVDRVSKRINRFLVHHAFLQEVGSYRSWVVIVRCLDHTLVFSELGRSDGKSGAPFKYNHSWVEVE
jgi:hypothetical protein